ncbi:hypothetical protein PR048_002046, partial [Dryococelus australis]
MKLPRAVEDLARYVYNYFQCSSKCIDSLAEFQEFYHAVVSQLLEQYDALKLFLTDAVFTDCMGATETILNMLNDPVQKRFHSFLEFALELFNKLNRQMQSEKPQIHLLHTVMLSTVHTLLECFISEHHLLNTTAIENVQFKNPKYSLQLENMYIGAKVNALCAKGIDKLTKERNRLSTDTLVGLLYTKRKLQNSKCFDFPISIELVNKMTAPMYDADRNHQLMGVMD